VSLVDQLKERARAVQQQTYVVYFAIRDPRTPWYARALAVVVVAYALSPIDLIPDFVPVLGYLDDLILVPLGIALVLRLIPADVRADCTERARLQTERKVSRVGAAAIVIVWLVAAVWLALLVRNLLH
jgi:uncharacterized membrane protein YkvA (DUF1232 family)